ncbi:STAS domain-containing protein [Paucibacter sp. AS339]|uniref:STAS domain-containing protein n=1 Tax=Paucibacter hankyongi TaxID=3133434 RepID=UPI0030ACF940
MLRMPASVRMGELPSLWAALQPSLRAEAAQVRSGAGAQLNLCAGDLSQFDSAALTLLLSAARLCSKEGIQLQVHDVPAKLQELARVYGVAELLWPELLLSQAKA